MLGILQVNYEKNSNKVILREITIKKVKFLEITVDINRKTEKFFSKILINRAFYLFKKNNIKKICAKVEFKEYLEKNNMEFVSHFEILYAKRYEILKKLNKKTIFVYSKYHDISNMVDFLARNFDDIFLNISVNKEQIKELFLSKYGVSTVDFNQTYKKKEGIFLCFDKPENFSYGEIIFNLSKEKMPVLCIDDILCQTSFYAGNTDITAVCSAIVKNNFNLEKNIYIKKIIINTWHFVLVLL